MSNSLNRHDLVLLFDVTDGNPNGDPDAGNLPRIDPETGHGLVTDVCLKRKVRNYILATKQGVAGFDIFVKEKAILNQVIEEEYAKLEIDLEAAPKAKTDGSKRADKGKAQGSEVEQGRIAMCRRYFDVRTFGAVMSTGPNAGQVRGAAQVTFARSIDPVVTLEHSITRMAVATKEEAEKQKGDNRTMGRKFTIPYGLYRANVFVSPALAEKTQFSSKDFDALLEAFEKMFDVDRSAARGTMAMRAVIAFEHSSPLGDAPAHKLFDRVRVARKETAKPPRSFADYQVLLDDSPLNTSEVVRHIIKVK